MAASVVPAALVSSPAAICSGVMVPGTTWCSSTDFTISASSSPACNTSSGSLPKAASVGANTVNGPPRRVSTRPALTAMPANWVNT